MLTDGQSYVSDSVLQSAIASNIKIYTIGLGNSSDSVLQYIADETGGVFFKAYTADELLDIYEEIGVTVEIDITDNDEDGLYDVYEVTGMRVQNGNIIYTDPTEDDTDGEGLKDGEEIDTEIRHREVYFPSDVPMEASCTYFVMHSNPKLKDSDGDNLMDCDDPKPLWYEYTPTEFARYVHYGYIEASDLRRADNDFTICMKPLGEIMNVLGIVADGHDNIVHFSDWYIYGFSTDEGIEVYSLIKLRTSNNNLFNPSSVSVPFRELDISMINSSANSSDLRTELVTITQLKPEDGHHETVRTFWAERTNPVNYFIADIYLELIIKQDCINGTFSVSENAVDRVIERLEESPEVYNAEERVIYVNDMDNLTLDERQCLLASRAGTISYNAFAAEIIFHAVYARLKPNFEDMEIDDLIKYIVYKSALTADLSAEEDYWFSKGESFYAYEDSSYVDQQEEIFGEY